MWVMYYQIPKLDFVFYMLYKLTTKTISEPRIYESLCGESIGSNGQ